MAELRLYPNLPGVVSLISVETQLPTFDDTMPKVLILGNHNEDQFTDGTPIFFNEPYFVISDTMLQGMFASESKLGAYASVVGNTSGWEVIPVIVRIGKKDIQAGSGTSANSITLSAAASNGFLTQGSIKVSWVGEPTWRANFLLKVEYSEASNTASIYVNNVRIKENVSLPVELNTLGLRVQLDGTPTDDETAYFKFQYAVPTTSDQELYDAISDAMSWLSGIEVDVIYCPDAVFDATESQKNPVKLLAQFANTQSTQFKSVLAYVGTSLPNSYTFSGVKQWVNKLLDVTYHTESTFDSLGKYLVVVAGHGYVKGVSESVVLDLAPYVAMYILANDVYTGPINLQLSNVTLLENITLEQANQLSAKRITALYNKPGYNKVATILVGRTCAPITSAFTKISSVIVINEYVNGLREIADKFLGQPNSATVRMSMQSTMQNFTNNFVNTGRIAGGTVSVEPDVTSGSINAVNVKATIKAFAEIELITLNVKFEYQVG